MISSVDGSSTNFTPIHTTKEASTTELPKKSEGNSSFAVKKQNADTNTTNTASIEEIKQAHTVQSDNAVNKSGVSDNNSNSEQDTEIIKQNKEASVDFHLLGNYGSKKNNQGAYSDNTHGTVSFSELASIVGASGNKITKAQLISYFESLTSSTSNTQVSPAEATLIKNLIAKFEDVSNGSDYITSLQGANDAQDYKTITKDQVTPPVDVRV